MTLSNTIKTQIKSIVTTVLFHPIFGCGPSLAELEQEWAVEATRRSEEEARAREEREFRHCTETKKEILALADQTELAIEQLKRGEYFSRPSYPGGIRAWRQAFGNCSEDALKFADNWNCDLWAKSHDTRSMSDLLMGFDYEADNARQLCELELELHENRLARLPAPQSVGHAQPASLSDVRETCAELDRQFSEVDALVEEARSVIARRDRDGLLVPSGLRECVHAADVFQDSRRQVCDTSSRLRSLWEQVMERLRYVGQVCGSLAN